MSNLTADRDAIVDRVRSELVTGKSFHLIAQSLRSIPRGGPPMTHYMYARLLESLASYAMMSDRATATVHRILMRSLNPYTTEHEVMAVIAEQLAKVAQEGYFDVIGNAAPDAGRRSAHQHDTTLRDAIWLRLLYAELEGAVAGSARAELGWVLRILVAEDDTLTLHKVYLPRVWEALL